MQTDPKPIHANPVRYESPKYIRPWFLMDLIDEVVAQVASGPWVRYFETLVCKGSACSTNQSTHGFDSN